MPDLSDLPTRPASPKSKRPIKLKRPTNAKQQASEPSTSSSPPAPVQTAELEPKASSSKPVKIKRPKKKAGASSSPALIVTSIDTVETVETSEPVAAAVTDTRKRRKTRKKTVKMPAASGDDSFFLDLDGEEPPEGPTLDSTTANIQQEADTSGLLLPAHVFVSEIVVKETGDARSPSPAPSMDSNIKFVDEDSRGGIQRYFDTEVKVTGRLCSICRKPGHLARACTVLNCWTCGAKDEHDTRNCPMSITCWNCGLRGHASANCTKPRGRRQCELCGSHQHVQNGCPSLWRNYSHLSSRDREAALKHRASKIGLAIGQGGEGFIAWDAECFVCGNLGHWGFDCVQLPQQLANREPPSFSQFHADSGPWPFDRESQDHSSRFARACQELQEASSSTRETIEEEPPAFQAGRMGKQKAQQAARAGNRKRELENDDEDNWFDRRQPPRGQAGAGAGNGAKRARRDGRDDRHDDRNSLKNRIGGQNGSSSKAIDEVAAWFQDAGTPSNSKGKSRGGRGRDSDRSRDRDRDRYPPESREEREEREYLDYQSQNGGRYDDEFADDPKGGKPRHRRSTDHRGGRDRRDERDLSPPRGPKASSSRRSDPKIAISIMGASGGDKRDDRRPGGRDWRDSDGGESDRRREKYQPKWSRGYGR